jgi:Fur family ferric uptake transcriptional regulator
LTIAYRPDYNDNENQNQQEGVFVTGNEALGIFEKYLDAKNLKHSQPRQEIVEAFLKADQHLTAQDLFQIVKQSYAGIGFATVYRTLRLMCESGVCRELNFADGSTRYERLQGKQHHDHIICTACGALVEVVDSEIERLQDKLFKQYHFQPQWHRLELYGICDTCRKKLGKPIE